MHNEFYVDRSGWGPGDWDGEPDRLHWIDKATDMDCLAVRNGGGAWCGYVAVTDGHPAFGVSYSAENPALVDALERRKQMPVGDSPGLAILVGLLSGHIGASAECVFDVHGGITYSDFCQEGGHICHVPLEGRPHRVWWLGFDCSHSGDYSPGFSRLLSGYDHREEYRTLGYVKGQCAKLAVQLREVGNAVKG